jgi:hypothetical protein
MSNNLDLAQVAAAQNQKEVTINDQAGEIDAALTDDLAVLVDDTNAVTLTAEQFRRAFFLMIADDAPPPDGAVTITVPAVQRGLFKVINGTGQEVTVTVSGQSLTAPTVAAGKAALLSCDGSDVRFAGGGGDSEEVTQPYDFGFACPGGPPDADEVLAKVIMPRAMTLPANLAGSAGHIDTNPTAQFDIDVTDDGSSIGTISIADTGAFTFTTDGGTAKSIAAGSVIRFVAPTTPDATAASFAATLVGTLD